MNNLALSEATPVGWIVYTLEGYDPEDGEVTFGLIGSENFAVNPKTGEVKLIKALDRENLQVNFRILSTHKFSFYKFITTYYTTQDRFWMIEFHCLFTKISICTCNTIKPNNIKQILIAYFNLVYIECTYLNHRKIIIKSSVMPEGLLHANIRLQFNGFGITTQFY